ncbi:GerAB/ArcD/ProY family transporter [Alkalihalobacillus sp. BA299]|uniref:GerAB/ArcD/ProY family transporter n=1 Tax=Alkalihalobacillus sp. BA299 TaxID=2815938 RepID=UPI001ADBCCA5|nr:GerAB/ArcD/ProY family transporter [Alkalihalobacillus sp. BA299]
MGTNNEYQISPIEMGVTLISLIFGVGILTLPRALANRVGTTDGWISILIAGLISMVLIYFYTRLQQNFPNEGLLQYLAKGKVGKWGAKAFAFLFIFYFTNLLALQARLLAMAVKMYLIDRTPSEVIVAIILLVTTYAASKGIQGIIHIHLMFMPFILFALFIVIIFNLAEADFNRLSPILSEGFVPVLSGIFSPMFSFVGIFFLFFFMTYMKASDLRSLPLNIAMMFLIITYTFLTIISYAVFGFEMSKVITFPAIELAKEIEIIGKFIERLESIFLTIYIMAIFTTMATVLFTNYKVINEQFLPNNKNRKWVPPVIIFIIFIVTFIPDSINSLKKLGEFIAILGDSLLGAGIAIGYMTVWLRKRRKTSYDNVSQT